MNTSHCVCHFHTAGTYGRDGVNELLSKNGVDMSTSLCLQGGGAVPALAPLSPWFGPGVSIKDGRLCATGLSLTYTPLKVRRWRQGRAQQWCCCCLLRCCHFRCYCAAYATAWPEHLPAAIATIALRSDALPQMLLASFCSVHIPPVPSCRRTAIQGCTRGLPTMWGCSWRWTDIWR